MSGYIPNAQTPEQHAANVRFQLENVQGWLERHTDTGEDSDLEAARAKAGCVLEAAGALLASLEAACRKKRAKKSEVRA